MIWREKSTLLTVLGIVLLANTIFFFTYRVQYQSRIESLNTRLTDANQELDQSRNASARATRTFQSYRQVEKDVQNVYDEHWSTERKRLTMLIGEVQHLATVCNLAPPAYSFDKRVVKSENTGGRRVQSLGANEVGISFTVQGTYQQIRRLINLLELSRQFVIIDSIGLTAADADKLTLTLHLKTLFREESADTASNHL
jgi:hypothetical protein